MPVGEGAAHSHVHTVVHPCMSVEVEGCVAPLLRVAAGACRARAPLPRFFDDPHAPSGISRAVSYTHLRAHETSAHL
eukprot:10792449-Alexandrium_andersonii.AAC.1